MIEVKKFRLLFFISLFVIIKIKFSVSLYEDQIGKFDWRQQYIGKVKYVHLDPLITSSHKLALVTEQNVLAMLNTRTGALVWRQVLEKNALGQFNALSSEGDLITLNGGGQYIRGWDASTGILEWEMTLPNVPVSDHKQFYVNSANKDIIMVQIHKNSHIVVTIHSINSASVKTSQVHAPWIQADSNCEFVTHNYFACVEQKTRTLHLLSLKDGRNFISMPLSSFGLQSTDNSAVLKLKSLSFQNMIENPILCIELGRDGYLVLQIQPSNMKLLKVLPGVIKMTATIIDKNLVLFYIRPTGEGMKITAVSPVNWQELIEFEGNFNLPEHNGQLEEIFILPYAKKDRGISYKILLLTEDHSIHVFHQQGKLMWMREEALASIITAEILDLPLSETDAKIEQEFGTTDGNILTMLLTRLTTQLIQLQTFLLGTLSGLQTSDITSDGKTTIELTRDNFGLHKVIVVATIPGKIFGIDNLSGQVVWSQFFGNLEPFSHSNLLLFVQRTTAHFPYSPQCTIIGKDKKTNNSYIYSFNPITGQIMDKQLLSFKVMQTTMSGYVDSTHLRPILLLDSELKVHVYPKSSEDFIYKHKDVHYIFTVNVDSGTLAGYSLAFSSQENPKATKMWNVILPKDVQKIVHCTLKRPSEHVHSQGRVMGDRSVLYKYLNPNLAVIITEGNDVTQKSFLNVYFIDTVTGLIVYFVTHKRATGPVHIVHSENWAVYSYYNEKLRRMEMSAVELYEGKTQSNTTAFSSLNPPPLPIIEHQTYIFPAVIDSMADTITERGMTSKHLIIALPSGSILELPKAFLDPRRPVHPTSEHREEGLIPYIPELPIPSEGIINYNQTVHHIRGIQTAPSGLESTCLVFVYGLDLLYTRVTPSKTFDILKDDFDHLLISAVLLALMALSYATKHLAAVKALRAAWK
ncbi:ER membrane protein complex subunit 1 [Centruroides vittatus]|uniref:ER membrane protein complex subunit 1 n=1 Tax=Centruroides vittatus TaxID=120091 RepID=UPI00350FAA90